MFATTLIYFINTASSFSVSSYNTAQLSELLPSDVPNNENITEAIKQQQITDIIESNMDVLCLQELGMIESMQFYTESLYSKYPYSFSQLNVFDFVNLPRSPCSSEQATYIGSGCASNCASFWPDAQAWISCMGTMCSNQDTFDLYHSECLYCFGFYPDISGDPSPTVENALHFCQQALDFPISLFDGTAIFSKYPIVNSWYYSIPSDAYKQAAITITEIDICDCDLKTESDGDKRKRRLLNYKIPDVECRDTIIIGCVHLVATDWAPEAGNQYFPSTQEQIDLNIATYDELNKFQIEYILHNIMNKDIAPWYNYNIENVKAVFIAGDLNIGPELLPNNFDLFRLHGFMSTRELQDFAIDNVDNGCTYCADPDGTDLPNIIAQQFCINHYCLQQDSAIDHILIEEITSITPVSYNRIFTNLYDINKEIVCEIGGCSNQLCADNASNIDTRCEAKCEYSCLNYQTCGIGSNGECGWQINNGQETEYLKCITDCDVSISKEIHQIPSTNRIPLSDHWGVAFEFTI